MQRRITLTSLLLTVVAIVAVPVRTADSRSHALQNISDALQQVLAAAVDRQDTPGAVGLVVDKNGVLFESADHQVQRIRRHLETRLARQVMTVRHLMTHTSGIDYGFSNPIIARLRHGNNKISTGLFSDPTLTYALLGDATTMSEVMALARVCDPKASDSTIGSRLRRCGMYQAVPDLSRKRKTGAGRPALVFTKT